MRTESRHIRLLPAAVLLLTGLHVPAVPETAAQDVAGYSMSPFELIYDVSDGSTSCLSDPFVDESTPLDASASFCLFFTVFGEYSFADGVESGSLTLDLDGASLLEIPFTPLLPGLSCNIEVDPVVCTWNEIPPDPGNTGNSPAGGLALKLETPFVAEPTNITIVGEIEPLGSPARGGAMDSITLSVVPGEDLATSVDAPEQVETGAVFQYDVTVSNLGGTASLPLEVLTVVSPGWTLISGSEDDCYFSNQVTLRCPIDSVVPGAQTTVTFTAQAPMDPVGQPGDLVNSRWLNFDQPDNVAGNDIASTRITVVESSAAPDLVASAIGGDFPDLEPGTQDLFFAYPFSVEIGNLGDAPSVESQTMITLPVTDPALAPTFDEMPPACAFNGLPQSPAITCENGPLNPGSTIEYNFEAIFSRGDDGPHTISFSAIPVQPLVDRNPSNNNALLEFSVREPLSVDFDDFPFELPAGVTYRTGVEVSNNTDEPQDVEVVVTMVGDAAIISAVFTSEGACTAGPVDDSRSCDVQVAPNGSMLLDIILQTISVGTSDLTVTISDTGIEVTEQVTVGEATDLPDLTTSIETITEGDIVNGIYVSPGEAYTADITVSNIGAAASTGSTLELEWSHVDVIMISPLPGGCTDGGGSLGGIDATCDVGPLAPGASRIFTFNLVSPLDGVISHDADVTPGDLDQDYTNHFSTTSLLVSGEQVIVTPTMPEVAEPGLPEPVGILIENATPELLQDLELTVTADAEIDAGSMVDLCEVDVAEGMLTASCPDFLSGDQVFFPMDLTFDEPGERLVSVTAGIGENGIYSQSFSVDVTNTPICTLSKEVLDDVTPAENQPFTYRLTVATEVTISNVVLQDLLPPGQQIPYSELTDAPVLSAPQDCTYIGPAGRSGLRCEFPLAAGSARSFDFLAVDRDNGPVTNIATACGRTAKAEVDAQGIRIVLLEDVFDVEVGDAFDIEADVRNIGSEDAPGVAAELQLGPIGADLVSRFNSSLACDLEDGSATCDIGTLAAGDTRRLTIIARATAAGTNLLQGNVMTADGRFHDSERDVEIVPGSGGFAVANVGVGGEGAGKWSGRRLPSLDVYVNDQLVVDDIAPGIASGYSMLALPDVSPTVDLVSADDPDNTNPIATIAPDLFGPEDDGAPFTGRTMLLLADGPDEMPTVLVRGNALDQASDPSSVEFFLVHADPDLPAVDARVVSTGQLIRDLEFGDVSEYVAVEPTELHVVLQDPQTAGVIDGFRIDMSGRAGEAIAIALAGQDGDGGLTVLAFDAVGDPVSTPIQRDAERPWEFALRGNYPNPFNPATTLRFDLPEPARVVVEVFDVVGRRVLSLQKERFEAGAGRTYAVDASSLASGLYVYRVTAEGASATHHAVGRFVVLK